jgi:hypothetical protein
MTLERVARALNEHFGVGNPGHWEVYTEAARAALDASGNDERWQPIETAPMDTPVRVQLGDGMTIVARLMPDAALNDEEQPCNQWQAEYEGEHPECWHDGCCWESNMDGQASLQPRGWSAIARTQEQSRHD